MVLLHAGLHSSTAANDTIIRWWRDWGSHGVQAAPQCCFLPPAADHQPVGQPQLPAGAHLGEIGADGSVGMMQRSWVCRPPQQRRPAWLCFLWSCMHCSGCLPLSPPSFLPGTDPRPLAACLSLSAVVCCCLASCCRCGCQQSTRQALTHCRSSCTLTRSSASWAPQRSCRSA